MSPTLITESFNQPDSTTLGPDLAWTEVTGDLRTASNTCRVAALDSGSAARANTELDSADHYSEVVITAMPSNNQGNVRVLARCDPSAQTWYEAVLDGTGTVWLRRTSAGSTTDLVSSTNIGTVTAPVTLRVECEGTTIRAVVDGTTRLTATDGTISGNKRCGLRIFRSSAINGSIDHVQIDSFEAGVISSAAPPANLGATQQPAVFLTWDSTPEGDYSVRKDGVTIATGLSVTEYLDTDVAVDETYDYQVESNNGAGWSAVESITVSAGVTQSEFIRRDGAWI